MQHFHTLQSPHCNIEYNHTEVSLSSIFWCISIFCIHWYFSFHKLDTSDTFLPLYSTIKLAFYRPICRHIPSQSNIYTVDHRLKRFPLKRFLHYPTVKLRHIFVVHFVKFNLNNSASWLGKNFDATSWMTDWPDLLNEWPDLLNGWPDLLSDLLTYWLD